VNPFWGLILVSAVCGLLAAAAVTCAMVWALLRCAQAIRAFAS
jgi:hypothetical protein